MTAVTCEGSGGVGAGSEHSDWPQGVEGRDPLEGRPLLAVAEAQLALTVAPRGEHLSLSCENKTQNTGSQNCGDGYKTIRKASRLTWTCADERVVPSTGHQVNFI